MSHWLDAEEQKLHTEDKGHLALKNKRVEIEGNFVLVSAQYNAFIEDLYQLLNRVNDLPLESRTEFGSIEGREKETKLNNHLNIFSSSRRKYRISFFDFFRFFKRKKYKNIRVVYIYVSSHQGKINIEVKERTLMRLSMGVDKPEGDEGRRVKRQGHVVASLPVEMLDHEFALDIIDWLAFKKDSANSPAIAKLKQYGLTKR
ncbi:MAG: hypothetical protein RBS07_17245 [Lentimicrobium sp.]|jgi:hypothetical protein|nr:hypothetical protein [Lentimicrobium sp.]